MNTIPPDPVDEPSTNIFDPLPGPAPDTPENAPNPSAPDPAPAESHADEDTPPPTADERLMAQLLSLVNSIPPTPADLPAIRPITAAVIVELRLARCQLADAIEYGTSPDAWTNPAEQAILAYLTAGPLPAIRKTFLHLPQQTDPHQHALNSALTWLASQPVGLVDPIILAAIAQTRRIRLAQVSAIEPAESKNAHSPSRS